MKRVVVPHKKDCLLRDDPAPFVLFDGIDWCLNKNGVGKGGSSFYRFRCNDPDCPASLRVDILALSDWLGRGETG